MPLPTTLTTLEGTPIPEEQLKNQVILFVNVASQCGLTPQYSGLVELDKKYGDQGFKVIGVPCNQFGQQEPGSPEEIKDFTSSKYNVEFTLLEKQEVNGANRSPLYQFLVQDGDDISWNFGKFVVGRNGEVVARFEPATTPDDPQLQAAIEKALS
ncbi:glutathione peroxidase [Crocosphaera sp.]|uniref:glutathione peroxidase n=1 Tax=Crocosphaera sp. TaxID=2729996 RepID=UPI003F1E6ABA|nr:glutathione peroxidase [Crocosphaera sp.]